MSLVLDGSNGITFPSGSTQNAACAAWVSFTGTTGAINASYNIASVTRTGTGLYTIVFTNALTDANYAVVGMGQRLSSDGNNAGFVALNHSSNPTTTTFYLATMDNAANQLDQNKVSVAVFR